MSDSIIFTETFNIVKEIIFISKVFPYLGKIDALCISKMALEKTST